MDVSLESHDFSMESAPGQGPESPQQFDMDELLPQDVPANIADYDEFEVMSSDDANAHDMNSPADPSITQDADLFEDGDLSESVSLSKEAVESTAPDYTPDLSLDTRDDAAPTAVDAEGRATFENESPDKADEIPAIVLPDDEAGKNFDFELPDDKGYDLSDNSPRLSTSPAIEAANQPQSPLNEGEDLDATFEDLENEIFSKPRIAETQYPSPALADAEIGAQKIEKAVEDTLSTNAAFEGSTKKDDAHSPSTKLPDTKQSAEEALPTKAPHDAQESFRAVMQRLSMLENAIFVQQENEAIRFQSLQQLVKEQRGVIESLTEKITTLTKANPVEQSASQESAKYKSPQVHKRLVKETPGSGKPKKKALDVSPVAVPALSQESQSSKAQSNAKVVVPSSQEPSTKPPAKSEGASSKTVTIVNPVTPEKQKKTEDLVVEAPPRKHTPFKQPAKMKDLALMDPDEPLVLFFHGKDHDNASYSRRVEKLHGKVNNDISSPHTHLVILSKDCGRYLKTLIALASDTPIIQKEWIEQSWQYRKWVDPEQFRCTGIPNHTVKRQELLAEFNGASVGFHGKLKLPFDEMKIIIAALGGEAQQIEMTIRRKKKAIQILVVPEETKLEGLKAEIAEMPRLNVVISDADLINVIWEGSRAFFKNQLAAVAPRVAATQQPKRERSGISVPYLEEYLQDDSTSQQPHKIYPNVHSLADVAHPERTQPVLVGRSGAKCGHVLPYEGVSRVHFTLNAVTSNGSLALSIFDQNSTNGLFVNGYKRTNPTVLHENDIVLIGGGSGMEDGAFISPSMDIEYSAKFIVRVEHRS